MLPQYLAVVNGLRRANAILESVISNGTLFYEGIPKWVRHKEKKEKPKGMIARCKKSAPQTKPQDEPRSGARKYRKMRLWCGRNRVTFAPRIELAFGDSASLRGIRGAVKLADGTSASAKATKKNAPYGR